MPGLEEAYFQGNQQLFSTKEAVAAFAAGIGEAGLPKLRKLDVQFCDIPGSAAGELGSLLVGKICDFFVPTNPSPERGGGPHFSMFSLFIRSPLQSLLPFGAGPSEAGRTFLRGRTVGSSRAAAFSLPRFFGHDA